MPHEIDRILRLASSSVWLIDPAKAEEIAAFLALRAGGRTAAWDGTAPEPIYALDPVPARGGGAVHVLRLSGTIMPRAGMMAKFSGGASMDAFQAAFRQAASDRAAGAIVIEVDSPGGMVDLVPETAAMIYAARREGRPIVAVANTLAASAAYWLAAAADELVVTPSGAVGSIGVVTERTNMQAMLKKAGIDRRVFSAGPRKAEGHPYADPLDDAAVAHIETEARAIYDQFVSDVARFRGVSVATVRADPETTSAHFGGGRAYHARRAVQLGMADRVATLEATIARLARGRPRRSAAIARRRLAMI